MPRSFRCLQNNAHPCTYFRRLLGLCRDGWCKKQSPKDVSCLCHSNLPILTIEKKNQLTHTVVVELEIHIGPDTNRVIANEDSTVTAVPEEPAFVEPAEISTKLKRQHKNPSHPVQAVCMLQLPGVNQVFGDRGISASSKVQTCASFLRS